MTRQREARFGLGSAEGQYSMLWRAWVQGNEVYLAPRTMARVVKLSLHSSGRWRWAFVEGSALNREISGDRAQLKWLKPSPFIPGWVVGPSVMFPDAPVEGWGADPVETTKKVSWLEPPTNNQKVTVSLMISDPWVVPTRDLGEEKRFPLLAELGLRSGGRVWVAARRDRMKFEEIRGVTAVQARKLDPEVIGYGGTAIHITESNGAPLFVEMRIPKRQAVVGGDRG